MLANRIVLILLIQRRSINFISEKSLARNMKQNLLWNIDFYEKNEQYLSLYIFVNDIDNFS